MRATRLGAALVAMSLQMTASAEPPGRLRAWLPREAAQRLSGAEDVSERLRAYDRLAAHGTPQSVATLVGLLRGATPARTPREILAIVRGLAQHASTPMAHRALVRALMEGLGGREGPHDDDVDGLVRAAAAMGLARAGGDAAAKALHGALRTLGPAATAAAAAWVAFPPMRGAPMGSSPAIAELAEVEVLEAVADQRSFSRLRAAVRQGTAEVAARAAVALTRLGHFETVPLAIAWARTTGPKRLAGAEILALARHPGATAPIRALLEAPETLRDGLRLALAAPDDALLPALARVLDHEPTYAAEAAAAIAHTATPAAIGALGERLRGSRAAVAAHALARVPDPAARAPLEAALASPGPRRRHALRALALRRAVLGDGGDAAEATAKSLRRSKDDADRAAAAAWVAVSHPERVAEQLRSEDAVTVIATARWLRSGAAAEVAAERLRRERRPALVAALTAALAFPEARRMLPRRRLIELVGAGGLTAPLAALSLAERGDPETEPDVRRLIESPDAIVRAHVALGLGERLTGPTLGWLEEAYRYETDASVRLAIVRAAARRPEGARHRLLERATLLDTDASVRSAAHLALAGVRLTAPPEASEAVWVVLADRRAGVWVQPAVGGAIPMMPDPDGVLVAGALPPGPVDVRVAFPPEGGQIPPRRDP